MSDLEKYVVAEDKLLVEWTLEGDNVAFEFLIMRYSESINRLVMSRLGGDSAQDADDLMQESFIKVYVNLHRYNPKYTFGQWIYTIARNTLIDSKRKRQEDFSLDDRFSLSEAPTPSPEQSVINSQDLRQIELSIGRLSETHQLLFRMRFIDEYSYDEIAEKLKMPLGTVKTNIFRARAKMCKFLLEGES